MPLSMVLEDVGHCPWIANLQAPPIRYESYSRKIIGVDIMMWIYKRNNFKNILGDMINATDINYSVSFSKAINKIN